jgi:hypothetical protein
MLGFGGFAYIILSIDSRVYRFARPQLRVLNHSSTIVTSIELHFILFLLVFFDLQQALAFVVRSIGL